MKIGYHAVYDEGYKDALTFTAEHGFDFVQFDLSVPAFQLDYLSDREIDDIRCIATQNNVEITFHAPGDNVSLFCDYPAIKKGILDHFSNIIKQAERLNARHVTVHTGNFPQFKCTGEISDHYAQKQALYYTSVLYKTLRQLTQVSDSVTLCVENCGFTTVAMDVLAELFRVNVPIYLTLDIPKCYNITGKRDEVVYAFMIEHKDRIREVHVHDLIPGFGSHQALGTGMIDFLNFKDIMVRPEVWNTIEVRPREVAARDKSRLIKMMR